MIARVKQLPTIKTKRGKLMSEYPLTKNTLTLQKREGNISEHAPKQKRNHQQLERKSKGKSYLSMLKNKNKHQELKKREGKLCLSMLKIRHQQFEIKKKKRGKVLSEHAHK